MSKAEMETRLIKPFRRQRDIQEQTSKASTYIILSPRAYERHYRSDCGRIAGEVGYNQVQWVRSQRQYTTAHFSEMFRILLTRRNMS